MGNQWWSTGASGGSHALRQQRQTGTEPCCASRPRRLLAILFMQIGGDRHWEPPRQAEANIQHTLAAAAAAAAAAAPWPTHWVTLVLHGICTHLCTSCCRSCQLWGLWSWDPDCCAARASSCCLQTAASLATHSTTATTAPCCTDARKKQGHAQTQWVREAQRGQEHSLNAAVEVG
jgi:hypothetical protein